MTKTNGASASPLSSRARQAQASQQRRQAGDGRGSSRLNCRNSYFPHRRQITGNAIGMFLFGAAVAGFHQDPVHGGQGFAQGNAWGASSSTGPASSSTGYYPESSSTGPASSSTGESSSSTYYPQSSSTGPASSSSSYFKKS